MSQPYLAALFLALSLAACSDRSEAERRRALGPNPTVSEAFRVADADRGGRLFSPCGACHTLGKGAGDRAGPNLFGVMGKRIASNSPRFGYTSALRSVGGTWTIDTMDSWLAAPARFAPGTRMAFPGLPDPIDRADVIAFLQVQSGQQR